MKEKENVLFRLPLYVTMFIPLIMAAKEYNTELDGYAWYAATAKAIDIFCWYKMAAVIAVAGVMLCMGAVYRFRYQKTQDSGHKYRILFPLAVYMALAMLSTVLSEYRYFGFHGITDQFESVWAVLAYGVIAAYAYLCSHEGDNGWTIPFAVSVLLMGMIGSLQAFGVDIYRSDFMQSLIMAGKGAKMQFAAELGRTYISLYNPNYVGVMGCLALPVLLVQCGEADRLWKKLLYGMAAAGMLISVAGARSKTGLACIALELLALAVFFRKSVFAFMKRPRKNRIAAAAAVLAAAMAVSVTLAFHWQEYRQSFLEMVNGESAPDTKFGRISTEDENITIVYNDRTVVLTFDAQGTTADDIFGIRTAEGTPYEVYLSEDGVFTFADSALAGLCIRGVNYEGIPALELEADGRQLFFTNETEDGTYYYINNYLKPDKLHSEEIRTAQCLEGRERMVNGRGYIWARTLPLLKKYLWLGSGQDSFTLVYQCHLLKQISLKK